MLFSSWLRHGHRDESTGGDTGTPDLRSLISGLAVPVDGRWFVGRSYWLWRLGSGAGIQSYQCGAEGRVSRRRRTDFAVIEARSRPWSAGAQPDGSGEAGQHWRASIFRLGGRTLPRVCSPTHSVALLSIIELSSNSRWLLVGSWLFCIQYLPCSVSFWCMLGGTCGGLKEEHFILVYRGSNSFLAWQVALKCIWRNRLLFI